MKFGLQSYPETDLTTKGDIYKALSRFDNIILLPYAIGKIKNDRNKYPIIFIHFSTGISY
ncbi:hypothetical protein BEI02_10310 [Elizabethkingia sp. HvH-WGS333]|nr:hypothetical protein AMC91_07460 [Elizabethkingia miricola]OIK47869.1 hypothetical protein BEI02_10310 [Elizabethkingia sp. HvH-WGS333]